MPYFSTSEEWLKESSLLVQARPTTTRVVTKYATKRPSDFSSKSRKRKRKDDKPNEASTATDTATAAATASEPTPTGALTLKTFDPVSGACLKYRTDKAAEVGRLIAALGRLSKTMAALPDQAGDDVSKAGEETLQQQAEVAPGGAATTVAVTAAAGSATDAAGAGGKKKKKKGKK